MTKLIELTFIFIFDWHVIDSGLVKTIQYDAYDDIKLLVVDYVSKVSAKQRKGRVGRTQKGYCHKMYLRGRFDAMNENTEPTIKRMALTELCLLVKKHLDFLNETIEPPPQANVQTAIANLIQRTNRGKNANKK